MNILISLHNFIFTQIEKMAGWIIPSLARFVFAAVLAGYFWNSAMTKIGDGIFGIFTLSTGAFAQIFPQAIEAVSYDSSKLGFFYWAVAYAGTLAEFILPALIVVGLFTRLASIGMIGFVVVQSLTDIYGHAATSETIGHWFDKYSDALILDQRTLWVFLLVVLVMRGAGPFSLDRILSSRHRRHAESG